MSTASADDQQGKRPQQLAHQCRHLSFLLLNLPMVLCVLMGLSCLLKLDKMTSLSSGTCHRKWNLSPTKKIYQFKRQFCF